MTEIWAYCQSHLLFFGDFWMWLRAGGAWDPDMHRILILIVGCFIVKFKMAPVKAKKKKAPKKASAFK